MGKERSENKNTDIIKEIVSLWNQGKKIDDDGYEDLGFTLQNNALIKAKGLDLDTRKIIADILFPTN